MILSGGLNSRLIRCQRSCSGDGAPVSFRNRWSRSICAPVIAAFWRLTGVLLPVACCFIWHFAGQICCWEVITPSLLSACGLVLPSSCLRCYGGCHVLFWPLI